MSTLETLVDNVAVKLGDPNFAFYTEQEIKKNIGDCYRYYVQKLMLLGEGYFETTDDLSIVAGTETVSLAALSPAFWAISALSRYVTNGVVPMKPDQRRFDAIYTIGVGSGDAYIPDYKIRGMNIVLIPPPGASETDALKLEYVYIPTFPTSTTADAFEFDSNYPVIYEQNVEIRAALKCMESKDAQGGVSDMATFRAELMELDKAFEQSAEKEEYPDSIAYAGINYNNLY